jgi:hypothetical protein
VQRYYFTLRERDRFVEDDPDGTYLPDVEAALSYAEYTIRELRKKIDRNDPVLMMVCRACRSDQKSQHDPEVFPVWKTLGNAGI